MAYHWRQGTLGLGLVVCLMQSIGAIVIGPTHTCVDGWAPINTTCVKLFYDEGKVNFTEARSFCESQSGLPNEGRIVEIPDADYQQTLIGLMQSSSDGISFWVGIYNDAGTWKTTRGEEVTYFRWSSGGEPVHPVAMNHPSSYDWSSAPATNEHYQYCQYDAAAVVAEYYCADGWTLIDGACVKYFVADVDFDTASSTCQNMTAFPNQVHLFVPSNIAKQSVIPALSEYSATSVWIGLFTEDGGTTYIDILNRAQVDIAFAGNIVDEGYPLLMIGSSRNLRWAQHQNSSTGDYICEYAAPLLGSASSLRDVHWAMLLLVAILGIGLANTSTE